MRSLVVVFPASICAAIPIFRVRSWVYCRPGEFTDFCSITASIFVQGIKTPRCFGHGAYLFKKPFLPAEVRERFVRLRHLMHFVPLADRVTLTLVSIHNLTRERVGHGLSFAG